MHCFNLVIVSFYLSKDHLFVSALLEFNFYFFEVFLNFRQLFCVGLRTFGFIEKEGSFISELLQFLFKSIYHWLKISSRDFICVHDRVVSVLTDRASETYSTCTVFAKASNLLITVLCASRRELVWKLNRYATSTGGSWAWLNIYSFNH